MASPLKELHRAIRSAIVAATDVTDVVPATRVYDYVPHDPVYPFIKVMLDDAIEDDGCIRAWTCSATIHCYSRKPGTIQAKEINAAIRDAVDNVSSVTGFDLNYVQFRFERVLEEKDGVTTHGVVNIEFGLTEV